MTNLKKNIDVHMKRKGIKKYTDLLRGIARQLGYNFSESYAFADKEKANFSKMLNGERPLKYEFIIPLEKIFGVSLARLLDENAYKLPIEKDNVPFDKGFRYYAYLDDMNLYEKELDVLLSKSLESRLHQQDEFGKTFLDYVVEYKSINGVRFLNKKYKLKLSHWYNQFDTEPKGMFWTNDDGLELARMIANANDPDLFYEIFDHYYIIAVRGFYDICKTFNNSDYLEILMDHKDIFDRLFLNKEYTYKFTSTEQRIRKKESESFSSINPIINYCLNYALMHLDKYKDQAIEILKFGINHNREIIEKVSFNQEHYVIEESGALKNHSRDWKMLDIFIYCNIDKTGDLEIDELIRFLPKYDFIKIGNY